MASDDLLDVDAGGTVVRTRGTLLLLREGKEGVRAEVGVMARTQLRALSTMVLGNPHLRKKVDMSEAPWSNLASSERMRRKQR
eukprot:g16348.t1